MYTRANIAMHMHMHMSRLVLVHSNLWEFFDNSREIGEGELVQEILQMELRVKTTYIHLFIFRLPHTVFQSESQ